MADRRIDGNFSQGWGIAAFITALAVGSFVTAGIIKQRTYQPPSDPTAPSSARPKAHATPADSKGAEAH